MVMQDAMNLVGKFDPEVGAMIRKEYDRQVRNIELIASENIVSEAVLAAMGSVLTNKYAEGYPAKRYYGGCECVDEVENLAIARVCKLFGAQFANVQPHSGAQANMAVYQALCKPGDVVLGMSLDNGGHLTTVLRSISPVFSTTSFLTALMMTAASITRAFASWLRSTSPA